MQNVTQLLNNEDHFSILSIRHIFCFPRVTQGRMHQLSESLTERQENGSFKAGFSQDPLFFMLLEME